MRIVFMGTPDFAAASLQKLIEEHFEVVGVFTQPDKMRDRGMTVSFSPVKEAALAAGIPVYQPDKMRDGTTLAVMRDLAPDLLVVVAYGRILPDELLAVPGRGAINVHGSLLPKYRGSAPIQWAVLNGDTVTGVSIMYLSSEMDAGDVIYTEETAIGEYETSGGIFDRLKLIGANLLVKALRDMEAGEVPRTPQDHSKASYTKKLDKSLSPVNWNQSPRAVLKWIYGLQPWPVATAEIGGVTCRLFAAEFSREKTDKEPGCVVRTGKIGILMACADGETLWLTELQAPGKKRMAAADYLRGHPISVL